jgi:hypothetical protein
LEKAPGRENFGLGYEDQVTADWPIGASMKQRHRGGTYELAR